MSKKPPEQEFYILHRCELRCLIYSIIIAGIICIIAQVAIFYTATAGHKDEMKQIKREHAAAMIEQAKMPRYSYNTKTHLWEIKPEN